jgi:hypothetical protein
MFNTNVSYRVMHPKSESGKTRPANSRPKAGKRSPRRSLGPRKKSWTGSGGRRSPLDPVAEMLKISRRCSRIPDRDHRSADQARAISEERRMLEVDQLHFSGRDKIFFQPVKFRETFLEKIGVPLKTRQSPRGIHVNHRCRVSSVEPNLG